VKGEWGKEDMEKKRRGREKKRKEGRPMEERRPLIHISGYATAHFNVQLLQCDYKKHPVTFIYKALTVRIT